MLFFFLHILIKIEESIQELDLPHWQDGPYSQQTDSIIYISHLLNLVNEDLLQEEKSDFQAAVCKNNVQKKGVYVKKEKRDLKEKKIKKIQNSPFHNYQKHLNNALKKLIIVPTFDGTDEGYKKAASQIWTKYIQNQIKTKKILHAIFNQRNEHKFGADELKSYGLWDIYSYYGEQTFNQAKIYLGKLAIDQIDEQNIQGYLKTRKLKKIEGFKQYILQFKQELNNGYLKRRVQ